MLISFTLSHSAREVPESDARLLQTPPADAEKLQVFPATFPLTPGQKSLWFMQQLLPDSTVYNVGVAVRILSQPDISALRSALQTIADRHDSLRTVFGMDAHGELTQTVCARGPVAFERIDTRSSSPDETDAAVTTAFRHPFDLAAGPLFRAHLFTDQPESHLLLIAAHHLACDGLSVGLVFSELLELYRSARAGQPHSLLPAKIQHRDFVNWQSQMLAGPEGEAHLAFWREQLQAAPPVLDLPTDHQRPVHPKGCGGQLWFHIEDGIVHGVKELAGRLGVSSFDVFAAGWSLLLNRYSGQSDVLTGFVTSGRPHLRYGRSTGLFSNTIVLRAQFDRDPVFSDFLLGQHERLARGLAHQDYPFPLLVERLHPARVPGHMRLIQVLFMYFSARGGPLAELTVTGHEPVRVQTEAFAMESYGLKQEDFDYDLSMTVAEGKRCWGRIRFDSDLFGQTTIRRLASHYQNLLDAVATNASRPVSTIPLLGKAEREQILFGWNPPKTCFPPATARDLFERQVSATPDRIAVICGEIRLTYGELNGRAELLAEYLRESGARPGSLVGICMGRSVDMLAALLAVWKAGAAYVALDPRLPRVRIDLILEDAAPPTIITEGALADLFRPGSATVIVVDADSHWSGAARRPEPELPISGSDLAYVLYTSGSTGTPKGVEIPHSAFANFLLSMLRRPGLNRDDILLAVTTLSFDIAGLELFLPIIAGATVVIAAHAETLDGRLLAREIENRRVTVMQATPATWRLLTDSDWAGCGRLKALCGGEAWPPDLAAKLLPRVASLWNMYGPTETTVWSAVHETGPDDDPIPLGMPIDNTTLYILDHHLEPVPVGVTGELHIGGAGLARGYRNNRLLTASRFIESPFLSGERLYKTGDLCRYREGPAIHFLGRLDDQVKLRGHRIELGEIESALLQHESVCEAAVIVKESPDSTKRLIAYLVPMPGAAAGLPAGFRQFLSTRLPEYMIPSAFVFLASMPLTPSAKVDRKALSGLASGAGHWPPDRENSREYVEPRTPTEAAVATLWTEILKAPRVGSSDRFDELGGDSLSFALMTIRAGTQLGIRIPVRMDGDLMSVAGFAREADRIAGELSPSSSGMAPADPPSEPATPTQALTRTWYGQLLLRTCAAVVRCVLRLEVDGLENIPTRGPAIIAGNHVSLFDMTILASAIASAGSIPVAPTFIIAGEWRWLAEPFVSQLGHTIYIRRGQGDIEALRLAREVLANRGMVAVTPEGRPTRGALTRAKPGVGYLACETGTPVWPLAIFGHDQIFGFLRRLRRAPVTVRLGKSLILGHGGQGNDDFQQQADSIMKAIAALMPPEYHGVYSGAANMRGRSG